MWYQNIIPSTILKRQHYFSCVIHSSHSVCTLLVKSGINESDAPRYTASACRYSAYLFSLGIGGIIIEIMYNYGSLISSCHDREEEEIAQAIDTGAMMLRRLSPRLERNFFPKFQELGWQYSRRLRSLHTSAEFDDYHHEFVTAFRDTIKTRSGTVISYGEAQQPINIFLKDYVDNIHLLGTEEAARLRQYIHVTMDGVMIYYFQSFFREDYLRHIAPYHNASGCFDNCHAPSFHHQDLSQSQLTQLLFFSRDTYCAWQSWFRQIYPSRPSLLDAVWSIARKTLFSGGLYWSAPSPQNDHSLKGRLFKLLNLGRSEVF